MYFLCTKQILELISPYSPAAHSVSLLCIPYIYTVLVTILLVMMEFLVTSALSYSLMGNDLTDESIPHLTELIKSARNLEELCLL